MYRLLILLATLPLAACATVHALRRTSGSTPALVYGVYRFESDTARNPDGTPFNIWIVDGNRTRDSVFDEWLYGGNQERYPFNPIGEIWIDNDISCQEYEYTVRHELLEEQLMHDFGMTYGDAHDSALALEHVLRMRDKQESAEHEAHLRPVTPIDCDSEKELPNLPDHIRLHNIYLAHYKRIDSIDVWIVDGNAVRRDIFPDFGFSGNDLAYYFIPSQEIWLDNAMSCEAIRFSIATEYKERQLMQNGLDFDSAYQIALTNARMTMRSLYHNAQQHPPVLLTTPRYRDVGTGTPH